MEISAMMSKETFDYLMTMYFRQIGLLNARQSLEIEQVLIEDEEVTLNGEFEEVKLDG